MSAVSQHLRPHWPDFGSVDHSVLGFSLTVLITDQILVNYFAEYSISTVYTGVTDSVVRRYCCIMHVEPV